MINPAYLAANAKANRRAALAAKLAAIQAFCADRTPATYFAMMTPTFSSMAVSDNVACIPSMLSTYAPMGSNTQATAA